MITLTTASLCNFAQNAGAKLISFGSTVHPIPLMTSSHSTFFPAPIVAAARVSRARIWMTA